MKLRTVISVLFLTLILSPACVNQTTNSSEAQTVVPLIVHTQNGDVLLQVEIADTAAEQTLGLMYRPTLSENGGMLFVFSEEADHTFWMKNTEISLDIIYIDASKTVVGIIENTTPNSEQPLSAGLLSRYVLEVNAGYTSEHQIKISDTVEY